MQKLKAKWGINSNFQLVIIFIVFAITGSSSVYVAKPFLEFINLDRTHFPENFWGSFGYYALRILLIFPFYQVLLVLIGTLFGQFKFFWNFEKKMLNRLSRGTLFGSVKK
ncbi:DUF6787 family protein [Mesonia aestuariivivens]|uniref:Diacylglyceryl transferase n=1 Tax=Mesonia aestuariivivens TaxID=2796128 RepID=A0ABS6VZJ5_9FLAO|nr:DUF6787 family protein [Mesonia aestuariivivens]MBW2960686.1 diacylglyceryl transferase [Mesonia aestuariivivens]